MTSLSECTIKYAQASFSRKHSTSSLPVMSSKTLLGSQWLIIHLAKLLSVLEINRTILSVAQKEVHLVHIPDWWSYILSWLCPRMTKELLRCIAKRQTGRLLMAWFGEKWEPTWRNSVSKASELEEHWVDVWSREAGGMRGRECESELMSLRISWLTGPSCPLCTAFT